MVVAGEGGKVFTGIKKRDGRVELFEVEKITNALRKAGAATGEFGDEIAQKLTLKVLNLAQQAIPREIPTVEEIQDVVEEVLLSSPYRKTAKAYIIYREQHAGIREIAAKADVDLVDQYLEKLDWQVNENSNMSFSLQGLNNYVSSEISKIYWMRKIYPPEVRQAHTGGDFHIHDLNLLSVYCVGWDLFDLLVEGFKGAQGKIESKPAKHLRSALGQVVNFFYTLQGEAAGAQAFSNFDTLLSPFIRYDGLGYKEVKQALQEFVFNINVPTRVGFQTPFTNITLDLTVPEYYANQGVIIGGEIQKAVYKEFQEEMELFNRALLEVMAEGDAKGRVFSVDGACLCLIKNSGKMRLIKIGDYIDGLMEKGKPIYIKENNCQVLDVRKSDINCLGLKEGKIDWQKVNFLVRHQQKNLLRICTQGGFSIKVTPSHSVLVLKGGKIQSFEAEKLKEGDYLIMPKVIPQGESKTSKLSLAEEFLKKGKARGIYVRQATKNKKPSVFPLTNIAERLKEFEISKLKLKLAGSSIEISNDLPITKELVEFLGWYCAEGSAEKSEKYGGISLGFNLKEEKQTAYHIAKLIEKIWPGIPVHSREIEERNLIEVRIHSKLLRRIITELFEVGNNTDKRVPQIIFELSPEMKRIFLNAYFKGDAWLTENIVVNSISRELIYGISVLLKQLDVFHTLTEYDWRGRPRWRINIWQNRGLKAKNSWTISKIPITESGLEKIVEKISGNEPYFFDSLGRKYKNTKNRIFQKFGISHQTSTSLEKAKRIIKLAEESKIEIPPALKEIEKNELSCLRIKKIEKTFSSNGMVYDFSTESDNFVADQFLVHNTFPIPTYNITKDFNWGNPNLDVLWQVTAKYGVPYFSNFINSDMNPEDARSMCCRLRIDNRELKKRGGGLFGSSPLTGCYDEKTEILTEDGWKFFKDLKIEDKVFTLAVDNQIEVHQPSRLFEYDYEGELIRFKAKSFDLLVTPNHRMVVDHAYKNKRTFVEAEEFKPSQHRIPKGGIWEGKEQEYFELPPVAIIQGAGPISHFSDQELETIRKMKREGKSIYQIAKSFNCNPVTVFNICTKENYGNRERVRIRYEAPSLKIKMDDWLKFFGFWIAEGSTDNEKNAPDHGYRVIISQSNKQKRQEIIDILDKLPFNYYLNGDNIVISNKQLWNYLRPFGNKYTKFIPKEIKNLSKRQLKILFDWMVKGDGHIREKTTGQINYWTSSKKLADDSQEIILKLGWMGTLTIQKAKTSEIKGRKIKAGIVYNIGVQKTKHYRFREKNLWRVFYKGRVYCCEVPNHTVYVRRNGKVSWCGNSIGVVTLNMPRLGYLARDEDEFIAALERLMVLAKESLEVKRKVLEKFTEQSLYPYTRYYLRGVKERFGEYWKNHFSTIGLVGMNEACLNLFGENIASKKSRAFTSRVLDFMRDKLLKFQAETGNNYNLEATPAEGTSYRLAKKDKEKYPAIICANEEEWKRGAEPFYTNSTQLPVNYTDDIFEALDLQDAIQTKYTGGTVFHIFAGERVEDPMTVKTLVRRVCELYHLPYFTFTPTFSVCPTHGYIPGEHYTCPECGAETEVYSRVVGYLRPVTQWNKGKREEFKLRKTFVVGTEAVQDLKKERKKQAGIALKTPRIRAKAKRAKRKYAGKQLDLVDFGVGGD